MIEARSGKRKSESTSGTKARQLARALMGAAMAPLAPATVAVAEDAANTEDKTTEWRLRAGVEYRAITADATLESALFPAPLEASLVEERTQLSGGIARLRRTPGYLHQTVVDAQANILRESDTQFGGIFRDNHVVNNRFGFGWKVSYNDGEGRFTPEENGWGGEAAGMVRLTEGFGVGARAVASSDMLRSEVFARMNHDFSIGRLPVQVVGDVARGDASEGGVVHGQRGFNNLGATYTAAGVELRLGGETPVSPLFLANEDWRGPYLRVEYLHENGGTDLEQFNGLPAEDSIKAILVRLGLRF